MGEAVARELEAQLAELSSSYKAEFEAASDEHRLREVNARLVGPDGRLTAALRGMRDVPADLRPSLGRQANALKKEIKDAFEQALLELAARERQAQLSGPPIDVTLPGRGPVPGRLHPIRRVTAELLEIFQSVGFDVADGPEIERYETNFDKLAFAPDHPAADEQDSFFVRCPGVQDRVLLRTHTSTVQIREMQRRQPPLAVVAPGVVYRRDDDATHSPMFHQLEGLLVDEGVSFADLKGILGIFVSRLFGPNTGIRFRASFFPFVEPGAEMDVACPFCKAVRSSGGPHAARMDCRICKGSGWLEVLGCGMVHPKVLENVGYDSERYTGFAFGMGIDRLTMLRYGIDSIRLLFENDVRFLQQF